MSGKKTLEPSDEQLKVIEAARTHNVLVAARPGSGKTAIARFYAEKYKDKTLGIFTFSKHLQTETSKKLSKYGSRVKSLTFHGLATKMFGINVNNEHILYDIRSRNCEPHDILKFDTIVVDEAQDLTENIYWLLGKYLLCATRKFGKSPRIIVLGDIRQAIFEFRGADHRFCEYAPKIFSAFSKDPWMDDFSLDQSFRLSRQNAQFVNCIIGEDYIKGHENRCKPKYIVMNPAIANRMIKKMIESRVKDWKTYKPEQCAIITPSLHRNKVISRLANELSKDVGIPVAVPISEEGPLEPMALKGKLTIATYHQMKGSERKLIVVYGADQSYFQFFGRNLPRDRCPNAIFVAITRAKHEMIFIHDKTYPSMPFVSWKPIESEAVCDIHPKGAVPLRPEPIESSPPDTINTPKTLEVSRIVRHVNESVIAALKKNYLDLPDPECLPVHLIDVKTVVETDPKGLYEAVSDLNGIAVLKSFEWRASSKLSSNHLPEELWPEYGQTPPDDRRLRARWFAREAAHHSSASSGYNVRLHQMRDHSFDWLDEILEETDSRFLQQFPNPASLQFESHVSCEFMIGGDDTENPTSTATINGCIDIVQIGDSLKGPPTLWEVKFTEQSSPEHEIQLAIYGYLWTYMQIKRGGHESQFPDLVLFNVRNGKKQKITTTYKKVGLLLTDLLKAKLGFEDKVSDEEFLERCRRVQNELMRGLN